MAEHGLTMLASEDAELPQIVEGYGTASSGSNLVGMVMRDFQVDSAARLFQEQQVFIRALFNSRAYYLPDLNFPTNTSKAFVNATRPKIQTAVALLMPILCPPGDEAWTIDPDPDTVDPAHALLLLEQKVPIDQIRDAMFQAAGAKADRLNQKISKGMHFARFSDKTVRFLFDLCLFGSGIMMGPMPVPNPEAFPPNTPDTGASLWDVLAGFEKTTAKKKMKKGYEKLIDAGLLDEVMPNMTVISPLDFYPDAGAYSIEQARRCTYRMVLGKGQVMEMLEDPTFRQEEVKKVLDNYPNGIYNPTYWETAVNSLNKQPNQTMPNGRYVCFQWWGWLTGEDLHKAGAKSIPMERFHERCMAQVWVIGNQCVKVAVSELHENRLPFYVCPYSYAPNTIWGIGPAEMMFDSQDAINACERSIMDNMALVSAPQVVVDCSQLADPTSILEIKPRRIWAVRGIAGVTTRPVEFFVPDCQLGQILTVQQNEERLAQEQTGLPNFLQGMNGPGTHNRTSEGANLQFNNSISSLKTVVYNIENNIIVPLINNMVRFYQIYSRDPQIQGNFRVNVHGVRGLLARESLISSVNDLLMAVGNMPSEAGRLKMSNVFKTYLRYGGFTNDDFVYSDSEYAEIEKAKQDQERQNQAFQGGMQSAPKLRAETPPRDALLDLVKSAPEGTAGAEALLQEAVEIWGFASPEVKEAFAADNKLTQFRQLNEAHGLGGEVADRHHAPVGNPLADHPHLLPPTPTDRMQNDLQKHLAAQKNQQQANTPAAPGGGK